MLGGALAILLLVSGITDEDREQLAYECRKQVWELHLFGEPVELGDMTEAECKAAKKELDPQTPPFALQCKVKWACREEL